MLTKAARQALTVMAVPAQANAATNNVAMFPNDSIRNVLNQERWLSWVNGGLLATYNPTLGNNAAGFVVGTGTTSPSLDDYKLQSQITSGITLTFANSRRYVNSSGKPTIELIYTVTNNSSNTITITEVGIVSNTMNCLTSKTATSVSGNNLLMDRTLLDTPVNIASRASASIVYTISSDMSFA